LTACAIGEAWLDGTDSVAAHDWSGAYVGLSYGTTSGEVQFTLGSFSELADGSVAGAHAGYFFQRSTFVHDGEGAYGEVSDMIYPGFDTEDGLD
jgi:hypothetical protein